MEYKFTKKPFHEIKINFTAKNGKEYILVLDKNTVDLVTPEYRCNEHLDCNNTLFSSSLYGKNTKASASYHIVNIHYNGEVVASYSFSRYQWRGSIDDGYVKPEHRRAELRRSF
jgi:hypothetical protein